MGIALPSDLDLVLVWFSRMTRDLDRIGYFLVHSVFDELANRLMEYRFDDFVVDPWSLFDSIFLVLMTRELFFDSHHIDR